MDKTSGFKHQKELTKWEADIWRRFLNDIEKADSKSAIAKLFDNLLSANEKALISKRLAAMALIKSGKSYKEIGRILWISPSTVSAIKKSVHQAINYKSNRYYAGNSKNEKRKNMKALPPRTIFDYWINFPLPKKTGRGRWKFLYYQR
ncbi:MAG: Trp family transcriptional regulator [Candidatus Liptonbacteria bacterium]|nr:Trp family transcriptional regulator [Candidatus Liptonbacteria bacterium]